MKYKVNVACENCEERKMSTMSSKNQQIFSIFLLEYDLDYDIFTFSQFQIYINNYYKLITIISMNNYYQLERGNDATLSVSQLTSVWKNSYLHLFLHYFINPSQTKCLITDQQA